jgi:hypothetical protein
MPGIDCSIARRASSWRKPMPPGRASTTPASSASASASRFGTSAIASASGTTEGTTDSRSTASRQASLTCRSRPSTASLTLAGTSSGVASASVTKKGFPRVSACTAPPSRPVPCASATTAARESGASSSRCTGSPASIPSSRCSGWPGCSASSRAVSTSSAPIALTRRAAYPSASSVASSAQCASSMIRTVGVWRDRASISAANTSPLSGPSASCSGPSVRGVMRSSQAAISSRARRSARSANARTSAVLPIPASPVMSAVEPWPASAPLSAPTSAPSGASRSSRGATHTYLRARPLGL